MPSRISLRRCELREDRGVVVLDLAQVGDAIRESAPVRGRMERLVDVQVGTSACWLPRPSSWSPLWSDWSARPAPSIELHAEELTEILRRTERRAGQLVQRWALLEFLDTELDLAH